MTTLIFTHHDCFAHDTGPGHPEAPERLAVVWQVLDRPEFRDLERRSAPEADVEQLSRVHERSYVEAVLEAVPSDGYQRLDGDTLLSPGSRGAILRAAGSVCAAVDAVLAGEATNAFCAVRPCGHHAEPARAMGFCVFNNIAVGALHARKVHGLTRVAVVDFDVHHGNGTQAMFADDPDLFFASTHQSPLYPGTGNSWERGVDGNILNLPLEPYSGSVEFRQAVERAILPALEAFQPELLLISAGFDAHKRDPLAQLGLTAEDFEWVTRKLVELADRVCGGRVVSALEGGYDATGLAEGCAAHLTALMRA
ncbi:acetoin utilization deacetylase AcuC-like enzyme [Azospirillum lipoferum]|uniref:Histone deacetylase family protein n=1 Tax=Azospirillum lipoferum TaxID=193 RepID=A0A5A9GKB2_AZOLI|nr:MULTISPECIES: histone deacetylase family protein [Azospirillum]KAA0594797.1 histone deacetylase family protein [Azospirillum lipoferum]MCP1612879.1 acetoin utilization deacetylase AcuC-like enzyme [Azospirillum lipoferum]MDW5532931.1 histone deacetylase family protein [Azospirillum sp. NL1]